MKLITFALLSLVVTSAFASKTTVKFNPIDAYTGTYFVNSGYGTVVFYAVTPEGKVVYPNGKNEYVFSKPGTYNITGDSAYNFCYPLSVKVEVDGSDDLIEVDLPVECE